MRPSRRNRILAPNPFDRPLGVPCSIRAKQIFRLIREDSKVPTNTLVQISPELVLTVLECEDHLVKVSALRSELKRRGKVNWQNMNEREEDLLVLATAVVERLNKDYGDTPVRFDLVFVERVLDAVNEVERESYVLSEIPDKPETAWDFHNQGNGHDLIGDIDKTLDSYSRAVELDPADSAHYMARARFYWNRKRDASKALEDVESALSHVKEKGSYRQTYPLILKARVLVESGRLREAIESIQAVIAICNDIIDHLNWDEDGWAEIGKNTRISGYYISEIVDEGIALCERFVEKSTDSQNPPFLIACALREFRRLQRAI